MPHCLAKRKAVDKAKKSKERFLDVLPRVQPAGLFNHYQKNEHTPDKPTEGYVGDFVKNILVHHEKKDH